MANLLESYGLDFLAEDDETLSGFVGYTLSNGKAIRGYYGTPYIYMPMGHVEFWSSTARDAEGGLYLKKFNTHCCGRVIWDMICSGMNISSKEAPQTERLLVLSRSVDNGGMLPVDIINADVLPSFLKGDKVSLQVVAPCIDVKYYASQDDYDSAMPAADDGKKWGIATGSMAPLNMLINHNPETYEKGQEFDDDCYIHFTASVKELYLGTFEMGETKDNTFIRCRADTQFGELEFQHSFDQVPEDMRENIRVGAIISGVCIISADAAIGEYENGIVKDFDHDFRLLRFTLIKGEAERLRSVLAENCVYETETSGNSYHGADEIVSRFQYVEKNHEGEYFAHMAEITEVDDPGLEYPVGTKCIVLAADQEDNYESVVFMEVNEAGDITRIKVSTDSRYHFKISLPERVKTPLDDIIIPESVAEPIIARAKFHRMIDPDIDVDQITGDEDYSSHEVNAQRMLDALHENPQPDAVQAIKNTIGYLFAKAIEQTFNERRANPNHKTRLTASYSPVDAFNGEIRSTLEAEKQAALEKAMKLGQQFGMDLFTFMEMTGKTEDDFIDTFKQAAIVAQRIGQLYSDKLLNSRGGE